MQITYHVDRHDEGWAYRLNDVWSEPFPTHAAALTAARAAAQRQEEGGSDTIITFQSEDGKWITQDAKGGDRPEVEVEDDG